MPGGDGEIVTDGRGELNIYRTSTLFAVPRAQRSGLDEIVPRRPAGYFPPNRRAL